MDDVGQAMGDQQKYSDQSGRKHDSMLGAQWADEEREKKLNAPSKVEGEAVKVIVFLSFVFVCTGFVAILKIFRAVAPEFSRTTPAGITLLVLLAVAFVAYLVGMTKFKSSGPIIFYSIAVAGFTSALCFLLPAL